MSRRSIAALIMIALLLGLFGCGVEQKTPQDYYDMGVRFLSEAKYEDAVLVFTALLEIEPNHVQALTGRGQALQQLGGEENLNSAQEDYRAALDIDDSDEQIWLALADLLLETGAESDAKDILAQAYEKFGSSDDLSGRIARLKESGALEGEDLSRFGLVADNTKDFHPAQLSQEETDEIIRLLRFSWGGAWGLNEEYDCTAPEAESLGINFILSPFHDVLYSYFPTVVPHDYYAPSTREDEIPPDPLHQLYTEEYKYYFSVPAEPVDWILKNIYNVIPTHSTIAVSSETRITPYYWYNGNYYFGSHSEFVSLKPQPIYTIHDIKQDDNQLYLRLNILPDPDPYWDTIRDSFSEFNLWVLMKKNETEERSVWSLCYMGYQPLEDISRFMA